MSKLFMPLVLLLGLQATASTDEVIVNCSTPKMIAGGQSMKLTGKLKIVTSDSGVLKIENGSRLIVAKSMRSGTKRITVEQEILVSGTYFNNPTSAKKIDANQEPSREDIDDRTYSEIKIDGINSSIFEIKGNKNHPLSCAKL